MRPHPTMTVDDVLREFRAHYTASRPVSGPPRTAEEIAQHVENLAALVQDDANFRTRCVGCEADIPIRESALCACGGFVCAACQRVEDGDCRHEPWAPK